MDVGDILIWQENAPLSHHPDRTELLPRIAAHYALRDGLPCYYGEHTGLLDAYWRDELSDEPLVAVQTEVSCIVGLLAWSLLCAMPEPIWRPLPMTVFEACGVFMEFLDARPCWQREGSL